tara:strand:- start:1912 stop:2292 length:381 start_codon:yes stop_codon:yes gene_type:complete
MNSTENFHPLRDNKLRCTCQHDKCDRRDVSQSHLDRVQLVRDRVGHPLKITSGGRCPYHPSEINRTIPADHQKQMAVDVAVTGSTRGNVVKAGIAVGCNAIGVAKTFVHLGYRRELPAGHLTMWVY